MSQPVPPPRESPSTRAAQPQAPGSRAFQPQAPPGTAEVPPPTRGPAWGGERWLTRRLLGELGNPPVHVVLWDGTLISGAHVPSPIARLTIRTRPALWRLVARPMLYFGEGYADGSIAVEGDLLGLLGLVYRRREAATRPPRPLTLGWEYLWRRARSNTLGGSRRNIHHHYDIGNDFYRLWLDRELVYTCAYFPTPDVSLEEAQFAKMDYVCRKLRLTPGETVVEAGCGWGALALHMAKHYGVRVKAYNISREQIAFARRRATQEELDDRVEFIEDDYRNVRGEFDVFASVGMLEHVGLDHYRELGETIDRCLKPEGRGLLHSIGQDYPGPLNPWIDRHIFPGAYPPSLRQMLAVLEPWKFSMLDVENLRLHYAATLRHWLARFEETVDQSRRLFDERFVRMWRLYLAGSTVAFETGALQLFQVVFARHGGNDVPWTRAELYTPQVPSPSGRGLG